MVSFIMDADGKKKHKHNKAQNVPSLVLEMRTHISFAVNAVT